jgi:hypothetical protein
MRGWASREMRNEGRIWRRKRESKLGCERREGCGFGGEREKDIGVKREELDQALRCNVACKSF